MTSYYYWVAASRTDNTGVGDTGHLEAESAQEAAEMRAAELAEIPECAGQVVRTRSADMSDTGEAVVPSEACCACEHTDRPLGTTTQGERMCSQCMREVTAQQHVEADWTEAPSDWIER